MNEEECRDWMRISAEPAAALTDEEIAIRVLGFPPVQDVTLHTSMQDNLGRMCSSQAVFRTSSSGGVDLRSDAPVSGTNFGSDLMELIWSMDLSPDEPDLALFPKTGVEGMVVNLKAELDGAVVASQKLMREYVGPGVTRRPVGYESVRGKVFFPQDREVHSAVIVIDGSDGGLQEGRAVLFASRGIASMALAYFAYEALPEHPIDIPLEYFESSIEWMNARPEVLTNELDLVGKSRVSLTPMFLTSLEDDAAVQRAKMPVTRIRRPDLLTSGGDDQMWPPLVMTEASMAWLKSKGHTYFDRHYSHEDARHRILTRYKPTIHNYARHSITGEVYAAACRDCWAHVLGFLQNAFEEHRRERSDHDKPR